MSVPNIRAEKLRTGRPMGNSMEAIWAAAEMRAGAAIAHSTIALDVMKEHAPSE